ncbi:hypothetical protein DERP_013913 [Dermatophagoides pteronyssinus]|uniref:Uncharacterized protein n=1 Tax=Dermatophagoides pteronyssinus TaxID=6956 RepID=A0ABQ8JPZ0_DERPT|nr:hypothetical protein DERP_013913 [Dermatophagoides pteronyssinus]
MNRYRSNNYWSFLLEQIWPNKRIETLHSRQLNEIKTLAELMIGNFLITLMNNFQSISNEIQEKLWLFALREHINEYE